MITFFVVDYLFIYGFQKVYRSKAICRFNILKLNSTKRNAVSPYQTNDQIKQTTASN